MEIVHIQLSSKTRKVAMAIVLWQNSPLESQLVHYDNSFAISTPLDDTTVFVFQNFVKLLEEGWNVEFRVLRIVLRLEVLLSRVALVPNCLGSVIGVYLSKLGLSIAVVTQGLIRKFWNFFRITHGSFHFFLTFSHPQLSGVALLEASFLSLLSFWKLLNGRRPGRLV